MSKEYVTQYQNSDILITCLEIKNLLKFIISIFLANIKNKKNVIKTKLKL